MLWKLWSNHKVQVKHKAWSEKKKVKALFSSSCRTQKVQGNERCLILLYFSVNVSFVESFVRFALNLKLDIHPLMLPACHTVSTISFSALMVSNWRNVSWKKKIIKAMNSFKVKDFTCGFFFFIHKALCKFIARLKDELRKNTSVLQSEVSTFHFELWLICLGGWGGVSWAEWAEASHNLIACHRRCRPPEDNHWFPGR